MTTLTPDETILGLIAFQTCHGYELLDIFRNPSELGDVWKMSTSQLYAVLKRLERLELIEGRVIESENAPSRTEYHLTPAGHERLNTWLYEPEPSATIRYIRVEFLSRLYVARRLNVSTMPIVLNQRHACTAKREWLLQQLQQKSPGISFLAHDLMIAQLDAVLRWLDRCELIPKDLED